MRNSIVGCVPGGTAAVIHNAVLGAQVTHVDPRCVASCVCTAVLVSNLINGQDGVGDYKSALNNIIDNAVKHGMCILRDHTIMYRETYAGDKEAVQVLFSNDYINDYEFYTSPSRTLAELVC